MRSHQFLSGNNPNRKKPSKKMLQDAVPETDGTASLKSLLFGLAGGALIYQLREQQTGQ
jgi:hypothetical protein